ncbi:hypothetical protein KQH41_01630, partial [bacterium]|nr:hypothetical protein [bacterium]
RRAGATQAVDQKYQRRPGRRAIRLNRLTALLPGDIPAVAAKPPAAAVRFCSSAHQRLLPALLFSLSLDFSTADFIISADRKADQTI